MNFPFLKKDKNLIPRDDKSLEDAHELDGWGLVVFGNRLEETILTNIYLRDEHCEGYRLKFSGHVCYAHIPEFLRSELNLEKIFFYPDCAMGKKEISCERCTFANHGMFLSPDYFK